LSKWITIREAVDIGDIEYARVKKLCVTRSIETKRLGKKYLVKKRDILIISFWDKLAHVLKHRLNMSMDSKKFLSGIGEGVQGVEKVGGNYYWNPMSIDEFEEWFHSTTRLKNDRYSMRGYMNKLHVAKELNISPSWAKALMGTGVIKSFLKNRTLYTEREDFEEYKERLDKR